MKHNFLQALYLSKSFLKNIFSQTFIYQFHREPATLLKTPYNTIRCAILLKIGSNLPYLFPYHSKFLKNHLLNVMGTPFIAWATIIFLFWHNSNKTGTILDNGFGYTQGSNQN